MGNKYMISAFDYPYPGYCEYFKKTDHFIVALFWFIVLSARHFGVDVQKRG